MKFVDQVAANGNEADAFIAKLDGSNKMMNSAVDSVQGRIQGRFKDWTDVLFGGIHKLNLTKEAISKELDLPIRQEAIQEGTSQYYDAQREILYKSFERELAAIDDKLLNEKIKTEDAEKEKLELRKKYGKMKDDIAKSEIEALNFLSRKVLN